MRFLVDECTGPAVAHWLRAQKHEVFSVYEEARGMEDDEVITKAFAENWILITNGKDFGEKIYRERRPHKGVVLLRLEEEAVLVFARVEGVPFTHNQAERDLRPAEVKQKVSGCFRTDHGVAVNARLQAVVSTCRKQGRHVLATLRNLFAHQPVSLLAGG